MPSTYDAGRAYAPAVMEFWLRTISSAIQGRGVKDILDLGCGTGRYSAALATHFCARVVAVDPSERMLIEAGKKKANDVSFIRGSGEAIPLAAETVDMVFISMAFHHFQDPHKAIEECHRVLRDGGVVCLRAGTTDRIENYPYVSFFPRTRALLNTDLHSLAFIGKAFEDAKFQLNYHDVIMSEVAPTWCAYANKIGYRADSILAQLTDDEFAEGLTALRSYAANERSGQPVIEPVDFFVFCRT